MTLLDSFARLFNVEANIANEGSAYVMVLRLLDSSDEDTTGVRLERRGKFRYSG